MSEYVAGFLFDTLGARVALVRKARPAWQAGRLNGIGGHIEPGETADEAMVREFEEETGVRLDAWDYFATVNGPWGSVAFYRAFDDAALARVRTTTDEPIETHPVWSPRLHSEALPNLAWLLPLARYRHDRYRPVLAREIA